ncbi:MAG: hypothetical protein IKC31_08025 [Clostridia bacterium]|nr:hypothetical protein [Clostridia bacterium]
MFYYTIDFIRCQFEHKKFTVLAGEFTKSGADGVAGLCAFAKMRVGLKKILTNPPEWDMMLINDNPLKGMVK